MEHPSAKKFWAFPPALNWKLAETEKGCEMGCEEREEKKMKNKKQNHKKSSGWHVFDFIIWFFND